MLLQSVTLSVVILKTTKCESGVDGEAVKQTTADLIRFESEITEERLLFYMPFICLSEKWSKLP